MPSRPSKQALRVAALVVTMLLVVGLFPLIEWSMAVPKTKPVTKFDDEAKAALAIAADLAKLLINWAFAALGAQVWILRRHTDGTMPMTLMARTAVTLGVVSSIASIFFGQLQLSIIATLVANHTFSIADPAIVVPGGRQFLALLVSLAAIAAYALDMLFPAPAKPAVLPVEWEE